MPTLHECDKPDSMSVLHLVNITASVSVNIIIYYNIKLENNKEFDI